MTAPALKAPKLSEAAIELQVRHLFTIAGGIVYKRSQGYRRERGGTRMTEGLSDLEIHFPAIRRVLMFETKTPAGLADHYKLLHLRQHEVAKSKQADWRRARDQAHYRDACRGTNTAYAIGDMDAARAALLEFGLARMVNHVFTLTPQGPGVVRADAQA